MLQSERALNVVPQHRTVEMGITRVSGWLSCDLDEKRLTLGSPGGTTTALL